MIHIVLHVIVPMGVALGCYRRCWRQATRVMLATMLVDVDHLLATPVYDPERCSIGFHPLHTVPAILVYVALYAGPLLLQRSVPGHGLQGLPRVLHWIGLGLLIHMVLDGMDCLS